MRGKAIPTAKSVRVERASPALLALKCRSIASFRNLARRASAGQLRGSVNYPDAQASKDSVTSLAGASGYCDGSAT
jgi:hypothetical protein